MRRQTWQRILVGMGIAAAACIVVGCCRLGPPWPEELPNRLFGLGMLLAGPPLVAFLFRSLVMPHSPTSNVWECHYSLCAGTIVVLGAIILMGGGLAVLFGQTTPENALADLCKAFEHR